MWIDLGTSLLLYSSQLFPSLILLRKFPLILRGGQSSSHEEKKTDKVCVFSWNFYLTQSLNYLYSWDISATHYGFWPHSNTWFELHLNP